MSVHVIDTKKKMKDKSSLLKDLEDVSCAAKLVKDVKKKGNKEVNQSD